MSIEAATFMESRRRKLSFAVHLLDDYSKTAPQGWVEVLLNDGRRAIRNSSCYYIFLDLPRGEYKIDVRSENYFHKVSELINTPDHNTKNPVTMILTPRPSYPFAAGETLVRGLMLGGDGGPISGGKLSVRAANKDFLTKTTERGEFVIYFGPLAEEDVVKEDEKYFVKGDKDTKINIGIQYAGRSKVMELDKVAVGKTRSITILLNML